MNGLGGCNDIRFSRRYIRCGHLDVFFRKNLKNIEIGLGVEKGDAIFVRGRAADADALYHRWPERGGQDDLCG